MLEGKNKQLEYIVRSVYNRPFFVMLDAKKANMISNSKLLQIMKLIEENAYKGITFLHLQYFLPDEITKVLQDYGYKVERYEQPIYCEDHYGKVIELVTYKEETKISW